MLTTLSFYTQWHFFHLDVFKLNNFDNGVELFDQCTLKILLRHIFKVMTVSYHNTIVKIVNLKNI